MISCLIIVLQCEDNFYDIRKLYINLPFCDFGKIDLFWSFLEYNFSHRIDHFSFGESVKGIINPLDGEEQVSSDSMFI